MLKIFFRDGLGKDVFLLFTNFIIYGTLLIDIGF
jgi:hypothetical protein